MRKAFKYRIWPTRRQTTLLQKQLEECRWLYNHTLAMRKEAWEQDKSNLSYYQTKRCIPILKTQRPSLKEVHSQVLQNVTERVDLAFQAYFRRVKSAEPAVGYPRFKGYSRYDSMTFTQVPTGCKVVGDRLVVTNVGYIKIKLHRPLKGMAKTATLTRSSTGKWYVCFSVEVEPNRLPKLDNKIGLDVGLKTFATFSDGQEIGNPRFFRKEEKHLAKVQGRLTKEVKGPKERRLRRKAVARSHERTGWKRNNFAHQHSRKVVNQFGTIFVEDLRVNRMITNHQLAKSIADAAWSNFFEMIRSKAEEAGRVFIPVNPAYTSQTCSECGYRRVGQEKLTLSDRTFDCPKCHLHLDRDLNAALNIKAVGLHSVGLPQDAPAFRRGE
jgi:putative transposase